MSQTTTTPDFRRYAVALRTLGGMAPFETIRKAGGFRTVGDSDDAVIALHQRGYVEIVGTSVCFTRLGRRAAELWAKRETAAAR